MDQNICNTLLETPVLTVILNVDFVARSKFDFLQIAQEMALKQGQFTLKNNNMAKNVYLVKKLNFSCSHVQIFKKCAKLEIFCADTLFFSPLHLETICIANILFFAMLVKYYNALFPKIHI